MVHLSTKSGEMNYDTVWGERVVKKEKIALNNTKNLHANLFWEL